MRAVEEDVLADMTYCDDGGREEAAHEERGEEHPTRHLEAREEHSEDTVVQGEAAGLAPELAVEGHFDTVDAPDGEEQRVGKEPVPVLVSPEARVLDKCCLAVLIDAKKAPHSMQWLLKVMTPSS